MTTRASRLGLVLAALHLAVFAYIAYQAAVSSHAQAQLSFFLFIIPDFPVSLLYLVRFGDISDWLERSGLPWLAPLTYGPYLIHGVLGTVWWYFLPRLLMSKRSGGLWGQA